MTKFKIGSRVRLNKEGWECNSEMRLLKDQIFKVKSIHNPNSKHEYVRFAVRLDGRIIPDYGVFVVYLQQVAPPKSIVEILNEV